MQKKAEKTGFCLFCGKESKNAFCSRECYRNYVANDPTKSKRLRICETCGKEFIMRFPSGKAIRGLTKEGRFCSRDCCFAQARERKQIKLEERSRGKHCKVCGAVFYPAVWMEVYCSDQCRRVKARKDSFNRDKVKKKLKPRACKECGVMFIPIYGDKRRGYCSVTCNLKHNRRIRRAKARALLRLVKAESVNPMKVFRRDSWVCQLCGKKLNPKHRGTYRDDAPELDHIIPLSKGGEHSYRNTQCTCRLCNGSKGNKEYGQARLF